MKKPCRLRRKKVLVMLKWFRKKEKPKTEEEMLAEAFAGVKTGLEKKKRIRERLYRRWWPHWPDRRVVIGLLIIVTVIIIDGVRRENEEFYATITKIYGTVWVQARETAPGKAATVGHKLADHNVLTTGAGSSAVLDFPDGSVVTVGDNTRFVVKLLEYNRGGAWRERSFFVQVGKIWARVSPNFGERSEMRVYTPSSIAAVRGTTFSIYQDPRGEKSEIWCSEGYVAAAGFRGHPQFLYANTATSVNLGQAVKAPRVLTAAQQRTFFTQEDLLKPIPPEHWLKTFELTVTQVLDAPLSMLGIGKSSWAVGATDFARRAAALKGLQLLHQHLEGAPTYPEFVNPATIEQLGIPAEQRRRILSVFSGDAIELYRQLTGGRGFILFARGRDKRRTLYKLTSYGPQLATAEELQAYR